MTSPRVLILGATGMLGSAVYDVLKDHYALVLGVRDRRKCALLEAAYGGTRAHRVVDFDAAVVYEDFCRKQGSPGEHVAALLGAVGDVDYVVNCIGVTIPYAMDMPALTLFVNGALPHVLARAFGPRLIHVTTDCVYNGQAGYPYDERALNSPVDLYGLSKSLGEPAACMTIRTSIIGRELEGFTGLLEWFLRQRGKTVRGYARHYWNGITTRAFGHICDRIFRQGADLLRPGTYHVFSTTVTKYEMLRTFDARFDAGCVIEPDESQFLNRTLATVHDLNARLAIPSFDEMVAAL